MTTLLERLVRWNTKGKIPAYLRTINTRQHRARREETRRLCVLAVEGLPESAYHTECSRKEKGGCKHFM